jgi:molybdopterin-binding protein
MLRIEQLEMKFDGFILGPLTLEVKQGAYLMVLGMSGAGKSVLLETLAGLMPVGSGRIELDGKDITHTPVGKRGVGLVYQDQALFPHLNVEENICYPLRMRAVRAKERGEAVRSLAETLGLRHLLRRNVLTLSGGEAQRVALARTLASNPDVLLLDEPLASLDTQVKSEFRMILAEIHRQGKTIIHVTHDYLEAASLGTHVAVIENGLLIQQGEPEDIFGHPANEFVACFSGVKNFFKSDLLPANGTDTRLAVVHKKVNIHLLSHEEQGEGFVLIKGEDVVLSLYKTESSAINIFEGKVTAFCKAVLGMEVFVDIGVNLSVIISRQSFEKLDIELGKTLWVSLKASSVQFIKSCL